MVWFFCVVHFFIANAQQPQLAERVSSRNLLHVEPIFIYDKPTTAAPPSATSKATPLPANTALPTQTRLTPSPWEEFRISKTTIPYRLEKNYEPTAIEWHYHADNVFDIDDNANPFSLPRNPVQVALAKQRQRPSTTEQFLKVWNEVTALNNPNTNQPAPMWLTFVIFGWLAFVAMQFSLHRQDITKTFQAFLNASAAGQLHREQKFFFTPANLSAIATYGLSMGIFTFLAAHHLGNPLQFNTFSALLLCILGATGFYTFKHLELRFLATLLPFSAELGLYNFIVSNTNKVLGLSLVPFVLFLTYAPEILQPTLLYSTLGLMGIAYAYRNFRAISSVTDVILFHKFHFFVYLCTVELAPLLIGLKLLSII